jgi:hypothetical protein
VATDDEDTPSATPRSRRSSIIAVNVAIVAAEDLRQHLERTGVLLPVVPAGFVERLASWLARAGRSVAAVERAEHERTRRDLETAERERDVLRVANASLRALFANHTSDRC